MILLLIIHAIFIAFLTYVTYSQQEEIEDMNRRLNILAKDYELLEADFQLQELAHQNALKQLEQINE